MVVILDMGSGGRVVITVLHVLGDDQLDGLRQSKEEGTDEGSTGTG